LNTFGEEEYESFFCSELVAAALKAVKLLPEGKASSEYWPVAFCQNKNLQLLQGASLGLEMLINFEL
jgi:hypothetical protein